MVDSWHSPDSKEAALPAQHEVQPGSRCNRGPEEWGSKDAAAQTHLSPRWSPVNRTPPTTSPDTPLLLLLQPDERVLQVIAVLFILAQARVRHVQPALGEGMGSGWLAGG